MKILDDPSKGEFIGSSLVFTNWQAACRTGLGIDRKPEGGSLKYENEARAGTVWIRQSCYPCIIQGSKSRRHPIG